jgi:nucleoside-diphosphate-sugar epimerase
LKRHDQSSEARRRVLVIGCGFAGTAIAQRFADAGCEVWGLRRRAQPLPAAIRPLAADVTSAASLNVLPPDLDTVIYCAAPDGGDAASYERVYVHGVRNVLAAVRRSSPDLRRFFLTSSTGVYGRTDGGWVDEATPPAPASKRGRMLLASETEALSFAIPATILRLGGLYGSGRRRLLDSVRTGSAECVAGLRQYINRIHRDDVAGAVLHLASLATPAALYLGVDNEPAERCEVLRWLAARLHAPQPRARAATEADRAQSNKRCSNALLRAAGYELAFPTFREGYADVLAGDR